MPFNVHVPAPLLVRAPALWLTAPVMTPSPAPARVRVGETEEVIARGLPRVSTPALLAMVAVEASVIVPPKVLLPPRLARLLLDPHKIFLSVKPLQNTSSPERLFRSPLPANLRNRSALGIRAGATEQARQCG